MNKISKKVKKWHRVIAMIFAVPMIITIVTGIFLIYRKELSFMQPQMQGESLSIREFSNYDEIESKLKELNITDVVSHYRLYPSKGIISVRTNDYRDFHFQASDMSLIGEYERNDSFFIKLHEGSYWGNFSRVLIFGPMVIGLFVLWVTGVFLGFRHYKKRWF